MYNEPFIDVDEWRDAPTRHRYVHGGFKGTELLFSFYFPPTDQYGGRFFQPLQAVSGSENSAPMAMHQANGVGFAAASGAYLVESNQGARDMFGGSAEANAAAAEFSRTVAAEMYGDHRPYGYVYGGSGGAFKTLGCVENIAGVWDGSVPFVHGTPVSIPHFFTVQAHAMRVLGPKFPQIIDAIDPGGSGDMYAGLTAEEADALREITRFGFPPRAWFNFHKIAFGYTGVFTTLVDRIVDGDPTYFEDFWSKPGYLGADPTPSLKAARIQHPTRISALVMPDEARQIGLPLIMATSQRDSGVSFPAALRVADLPKGNLQGASVIVKSGGAAGHILYIAGVVRDAIMVGFGEGHFHAMAALRPGDEIEIDNSIYLATQTYHRHQIQDPEFYAWDQYKGPDGQPLYPQRPLLPGREVQTGGATQSGRFHGKVIVMQALMDEAAYPWSADWYRTRVKAQLGAELDDRYRLWFVDHTLHTTQSASPADPRPVATTRVISYQGVLQQALRDLAAWVEKGVPPPDSCAYSVEDAQVRLPAQATARKGVQPTVELTANGAARAEVKVGETVEFKALIESPPGAGPVVRAEWDFEGAGQYPLTSDITAAPSATISATYAFEAPGTYFPALRATVQRDGETAKTAYARVQNLGRVQDRGQLTEVTAFEAVISPTPEAESFPGYSTKPYRAYVLAVLMVIYGINLLDRGLVALLQEKIKPEFHLSDFELGLLGGPAFALCNAFASLPVARLAERYNRNSVLAVCTALWSLMTALCGLAVSFPLLLLARFGVGIGEAGCLPPSQSLISDYFPANRRASAIAIHLTAIPIGTIIAGALGAVVADLYGWRMAFIALGAPGILIALICRLTVREPPRDAGASAVEATQTPGLRAAISELLSKRSFWHIAFATGLVNFVAVGNGQYVVSFMLRVHHVSLTQVGLILGPLIGGLTVAVGYAVGKILSFLMERDRAWLARWPAIGVALGVPVSVAAYLAPSFATMVALQIVGLLCTSSYLISLYTTAQGVVQPRVRATASALVIIVINTLGYGLGPPAIGALSDFLNSHVVSLGLSDVSHASGQGLRYALVCGCVVNLWAAVHYLIGAARLKEDWVG